MRIWTLLVMALFVLAGCERTTSAPEEAGNEDGERATDEVSAPVDTTVDAPDYALTKDEAAADPALDLRIRSVSATTEATSAEDLEAVTRELWSKTRDADALIVAFYPDRPTAQLSGTGYAFRDREAARAVLASQYSDPSEADIDEQVDEAMDNGGISVLSIRGGANAAN